ncbi:MAG: 16S rRNA (cytidine(1402)-2'-O)-methyltransferase [Spirochaetales bacterium]|nr:MAG: 16S rRNA (cytidine(1402)-2'-O)-methyltransferase [Spirochaetales bacterium]
MSSLFIVGTPIGNLKDITFRSLEALKEVDIIACEDTRHTRKLLSAYDIHKPVISCYAHRELKGTSAVLAQLQGGKNVAYVTDAGTPALSDPGSMLVREARAAGHEVIPIPGVSAVTTILSVAGFAGKSVIFEGFLSPKQGKRVKRLKELFEREESFILFESPHRIVKLLGDIAEIKPESNMVLGREMTKMHEEYISGKSQAIFEEFKAKTLIKGEFTLIVSGNKKS